MAKPNNPGSTLTKNECEKSEIVKCECEFTEIVSALQNLTNEKKILLQ